jgi:hypothetical protein
LPFLCRWTGIPPGGLSRFARKTSKDRRLGDFLPLKSNRQAAFAASDPYIVVFATLCVAKICARNRLPDGPRPGNPAWGDSLFLSSYDNFKPERRRFPPQKRPDDQVGQKEGSHRCHKPRKHAGYGRIGCLAVLARVFKRFLEQFRILLLFVCC